VSGSREGAKEVIKVRLLRAGRVVRSYKVRSDTFTIGSGKGCSLRAAGDTSLAPKHATVYVEDGELALVPEPEAVVLLNGEEVNYAILGSKDVVKAGKLTFRVELAEKMESAVPMSREIRENVDVLSPQRTPETSETKGQDASKVTPKLPPPDPAFAKTMLGLGAVDTPLPPLMNGTSEEDLPRAEGESSTSKRVREEALNPFAQMNDEEPYRLSWRTDSLIPGISAERKLSQIEESIEEREISEDRETVEKLAAELYSEVEEDSDPYIDERIVPSDVAGSPYDEANHYFSDDDDEDEFAFEEPFDLAALLLGPKEPTDEDGAKMPRETYCTAHIVRVVDGSVMEIISVLPRKPFRSRNGELACRIKGKQLYLEVKATVTGEICQRGDRIDISNSMEKQGTHRLRLNGGDSALLEGEHGTYKIAVYRPPLAPTK
jgi:hypothetical protein